MLSLPDVFWSAPDKKKRHMNDNQATSKYVPGIASAHTIRQTTMAEYCSALAANGVTVVPGSLGSYWVKNTGHALSREPFTCLGSPLPGEVLRALWKARASLATYTLPADEMHPQNAWLYVCRNPHYKLENLESSARRDARRAERAFRFDFIDSEALLRKGLEAYCDTRTRVGLSDGTPALFRNQFERATRNPAYSFLGAWKGDALAAFMSLAVVDDCVSIAAYAATEYLGSCPNNGLIHFALDHFLVQNNFRVISYGLSSIQEVGKADSLHRFKIRVGFEAVPVHRVFVFHPFLRPLANSVTLWGLRKCTRWYPTSPILRKATGMLAIYLGRHKREHSLSHCDHKKDGV